MRKTLVGVSLVVVWIAMPATWSNAQQPDCEAARCAMQSAVDTCCQNATNHGQFVSCVAHAMNAAARDGTIPTNCKGKVTRCAARSTCGKTGFSTCTPTCVIPTGATTGTCANDPTVICTTSSDCGMCHIRPSGTCPPDTTEGTGSCCPTCTPPS